MSNTQELLASLLQITDSWSVEYCGIPYDDARQVDGMWYYRHLVTREFRRFAVQEHVIPLFRNSRPTHTGERLSPQDASSSVTAGC